MGLATDLATKKIEAAGASTPATPDNTTLDYGFGNTLASGLTFGFWDELRGFSDMLLDRAQGGDLTYEQARDAMRKKLVAYQKENPGLALTAEVLGAAVPSAIALLVPGGQAASVANMGRAGAGQLIKRAIPVGMAEGAAQAYGEGEKGAVEDLTRIPGGALVGGATAGIGGAVAPGLVDKAGDFMHFLRKTAQGLPTGVVEAEIQKLIKLGYGDNPSDVINGIIDGRIMADNPILAATLREYRSRGARVLDQGTGERIGIDEATKARAAATREEALKATQEQLTPNIPGNVFSAIRMSEDQIKKAESKAYKVHFNDPETGAAIDAGPDVVAAMQDAVKRIRGLDDALEEKLQAQGMGNVVPFFKRNEDGSLEIIRQPSLEEAEVLRRIIDTKTNDAFSFGSGKSHLGDDYKEIGSNLRSAIDAQSPELSATRESWRKMKKNAETFKEGQGIWGRNSEKQQDLIQQIIESGDPDRIKMLQAGAMMELRNKARTQPGLFEKLLDENSVEGSALLKMFPGENLDNIMRKAGIAEDARTVKNIVDPKRQSITADQLAARENMGKSNLGIFDFAGAATLDPQSIARIGSNMKSIFNVDLTPNQLNKVVDVLFEDDPEVIKKIILGGGFTQRQMERLGMIVDATMRTTQSATSRQAGAEGGNISQKMTSDLIGN